MSLSRSKAYLIGCLIWSLFSPVANALSLGEIKVNSALNDPLDAEIKVYSTDAAEILKARIQLASKQVHSKAGLSINRNMRDLQFKPITRDNGNFAIKVTTSRPVSEFIIELTDSNRNLIRGYALHLDPPSL